MRRLTIIGTTPNGTAVILSDDKGARFLVEKDPRLAAVAPNDQPHQLEIALQTFSPRDVQARVRAGASAEVVAAETGWPIDRVLRYAEPLLAERAFIAEQAQGVEVRRSGGGASLLASAAGVLDVGTDSGAISWDAWRREDGKWIVAATYLEPDGPRTAEWTYDHAGRNIHPLDDRARALMGVTAAAAAAPTDAISDALDLIADRPAEPEPAVAEMRPRLVAVPDAEVDEAVTPAQETVPSDDTASETHLDTVEPTPARTLATPKKAKGRKGRASVPSWDEILFGATRTDD